MNQESNRGLAYTINLNDENIGDFYADLLGFKEAFNAISDKLSLKKSCKKSYKNEKHGYLFASINAFDNNVHADDLASSMSVSVSNTV